MTAVIGLDLSLTSTGVCSIEDGEIDCLFNIETTGTKADDLTARFTRLDSICFQILDFIKQDYTDLVVIEGPSYGSRFGAAHDRAGLWWMVVGDCLQREVPVAVVSPQGRAKYGTGKGNAKKDVVLAATIETYGDIAPTPIKKDDIADALLLASMGSRYLGRPVEPQEPSVAHLEALQGVAWPRV